MQREFFLDRAENFSRLGHYFRPDAVAGQHCDFECPHPNRQLSGPRFFSKKNRASRRKKSVKHASRSPILRSRNYFSRVNAETLYFTTPVSGGSGVPGLG